MSNYQSPSDFKYVTTLLKYAPKETQAFIDFDHSSVKRSEGHIPVKIRELIALAVALTTQCAYCIEVHSKSAKRAGASKEELAELISIAAAVRAGATMGHGFLAMRFFDEMTS